MSSQLISLVWDGHHTTLVSVFEKLLLNSQCVDCIIVAEGQNVKAHQEILSAFSPFFKLLFSEETEKTPTVILSGISFRDLRSLVDFMYQGKLRVTGDRIQDLIDAAECLQIKGLGSSRKEDDSVNVKNGTVLHKIPAIVSSIPHMRAEKGEREENASVDCEERAVNKNYSNEIQLENSVVISCGTRQSSPVQHEVPDSDVQNVAIVSNIAVMPAQSTMSEIEMEGWSLLGEYVMKEEHISDGDVNINEPMRDTSRVIRVLGNSGNSCENSNEETNLGLSSDILVASENKFAGDVLLECVSPTALSLQLFSRDLTVPSVKTEPSNVDVNSSYLEPVEPDVVPQVPLLQSEFQMETEDETLLLPDNDLMSENDEFSGNVPESIGNLSASDTQMKVIFTEKENDSSGAASGCISESTYSPQERPTALGKKRREGRKKPAMQLKPGLPVAVNPQDSPTHPSHTTPVCDRDLSGPIERDVSGGSSSTNMFHCRICNKSFTHNRSLDAHVRIHAKDKLFQDVCNNASGTSEKLNGLEHNQNGRKLYKCTVCDFKSVHQRSLNVHNRIHSGLRPFKCTECEYTSAHRYHLQVHQRTHSGLKPYKCPECEYTATYISNLKRHQLTHSGLKPYKCTECDFTANTSGSLKMHQRIHSGVKPYKCTECEYASASSYGLKLHQRTHSGVKPYECAECGYKATRRDVLKRHLRIHIGRNH